MISLKSIKKPTKVAISILALASLTLTGLSKHENKQLPINDSGREMTISFYHFTNTSDAEIVPVEENLGLTLANGYAAGVSLADSTGLSIKNGKISVNDRADFIIKNSNVTPSVDKRNNPNGKHTFLLTNGKGRFALGYAPFMNIVELNHALENYFKNSKQGYSNAIILASGNQCSFYKTNKGYHPFYLKELNAPRKALAVKIFKMNI